MKTILLNASPRRNMNTAQLLKEAEKGAKAAGAETEFINLYDLNFAGCRSCMLCKRKGAERCRCYWKDDLSPVIEKIFAADAVCIGTPIYLGRPTSQYFALMERLHFCALSYDDYSNYFKGSVKVGFFVTMNAPKEIYDRMYQGTIEGYADELKMLNGDVTIYPSCDTLQVADYSKFNMASFDEAAKKKAHEELFSQDLQHAYEIGMRLSR